MAIAVAALSVALLGAGSASALPGSRSLSIGFDADTMYFDPGQVTAWFPRMEQLGSTWVRIPVVWSAIAPARRPSGFNAADPGAPQYNWENLDIDVREAAASRQRVLLLLESPPSWALGPDAPSSALPNSWRPSASALGAFARAVAARYSGRFPDPAAPGGSLPRVSFFQVWNEPNLPFFLSPQWTWSGRAWLPASPGIYRGLLNAAYASIKAVQPYARVIAAGLAPYGDPPGVDRMRPVVFLRDLLCLRGTGLLPERCPDPAHLDAIDAHSYSPPTIHAVSQADVSVPDLGRLARVLRAGERRHRLVPQGPKQIWVTEIGWDSSPPEPQGVSIVRQTRYLSLALYEFWRQRVSHVFWYEVRDTGGTGPFTGAGLFFNDGQPKPSSIAFRFPFVAIRATHGTTTLWGRAPRAGRITIETLHSHSWQDIARLRTTAGGLFYARRHVGSHLTVRARVGTIVSYPWRIG